MGQGDGTTIAHQSHALGALIWERPFLRGAADLEEVRALAEADPKVKEGYLTVEAIPWMAVPSPKGAGASGAGQA